MLLEQTWNVKTAPAGSIAGRNARSSRWLVRTEQDNIATRLWGVVKVARTCLSQKSYSIAVRYISIKRKKENTQIICFIENLEYCMVTLAGIKTLLPCRRNCDIC